MTNELTVEECMQLNGGYWPLVLAGMVAFELAMDMAQDWSGTAAAFEKGFNNGVK